MVVCILLLAPAELGAAAGISDIAATRACWVRAPYALIKCESDGGRDPARLVRARSATWTENLPGSMIAFDGIVPLDTVVDDIDRMIVTPRYFVARSEQGSYWVVDLVSPEKEPSEFTSVVGANEYMARAGDTAALERAFVPFAEVYQASHASESKPTTSLAILYGGLIAVGMLLVAARDWHRRRKKSVS